MCYLFLRVASEVVHAHCKQKLDAAAQLLESVWDEVVQQAGDCCWKSLEVVVNDAVTNLSCKQAEFVIIQHGTILQVQKTGENMLKLEQCTFYTDRL